MVVTPRNLRRVRRTRVEIGSNAFCGHIPRTFDLLAIPHLVPPRVFRTLPAVQLPVFERVEIAERGGVGKVELDDIVAIVE